MMFDLKNVVVLILFLGLTIYFGPKFFLGVIAGMFFISYIIIMNQAQWDAGILAVETIRDTIRDKIIGMFKK